MLKKSLIFGSVALFMTALIALTGCPTDSDDSTTVVRRENYLYGTVTPDVVTQAVTAAKTGGRQIILTDGLTITGAGAADFDTLTVKVEGKVTVKQTGEALVLNAANATLTGDGQITLVDKAFFIYTGEDNGSRLTTTTPTSGYKVRFFEKPELIPTGTATHVAVNEYEIGTGFGNIDPFVTHLYVLQKLTTTGVSKAPNGTTDTLKEIIALGDVVVTADNLAVFNSPPTLPTSPATVKFGVTSTLTSTKSGGITIQFPATGKVELGNVKVDGGNPVTVLFGKTPSDPTEAVGELYVRSVEGPGTFVIANTTIPKLTVAEIKTGGSVDIRATTITDALIWSNAGKLTFSGAAPQITKLQLGNTGGLPNNGEVTFAGSPNFSSVINGKPNDLGGKSYITTTGPISFNGTGTTTIAGGSTITADKVVVNGALSILGALELNTNVEFGYGKTITFGTGEVTLAAGKQVLVRETPVLEASGSAVILKPSSTTLTAGAAFNAEDDTAYNSSAELAIGTGDLTITAGSLKVLPGALLTLKTKGLTVSGSTGKLLLADTARLGFTETTGANSAKAAAVLTIGESTISGGTYTGTDSVDTSVLTASGEVTFSQDQIFGLGATLTPASVFGAEEEMAGALDILAGNTTKGGSLTLSGVTLNLSTAGSLSIATVSTGSTSLLLSPGANPGKVILSEGTGIVIAARPAGVARLQGANSGTSIAYKISGGIIEAEEQWESTDPSDTTSALPVLAISGDTVSPSALILTNTATSGNNGDKLVAESVNLVNATS